MTTYDGYPDVRQITGARQVTGIPGLAVRLGRALEKWGRDAAEPAQPVDDWRRQRELDRKLDVTARMLANHSISMRRM